MKSLVSEMKKKYAGQNYFLISKKTQHNKLFKNTAPSKEQTNKSTKPAKQMGRPGVTVTNP